MNDYTDYHATEIGNVYGNLTVIGVGSTNKHRKKMLLVKYNKHSTDPF